MWKSDDDRVERFQLSLRDIWDVGTAIRQIQPL